MGLGGVGDVLGELVLRANRYFIEVGFADGAGGILISGGAAGCFDDADTHTQGLLQAGFEFELIHSKARCLKQLHQLLPSILTKEVLVLREILDQLPEHQTPHRLLKLLLIGHSHLQTLLPDKLNGLLTLLPPNHLYKLHHNQFKLKIGLTLRQSRFIFGTPFFGW